MPGTEVDEGQYTVQYQGHVGHEMFNSRKNIKSGYKTSYLEKTLRGGKWHTYSSPKMLLFLSSFFEVV